MYECKVVHEGSAAGAYVEAVSAALAAGERVPESPIVFLMKQPRRADDGPWIVNARGEKRRPDFDATMASGCVRGRPSRERNCRWCCAHMRAL